MNPHKLLMSKETWDYIASDPDFTKSFEVPAEPRVYLGDKAQTPLSDILGTEPLTSQQLVRKLWDFIKDNGLLYETPTDKPKGPHGDYCGCEPGIYLGLGCSNPVRPLTVAEESQTYQIDRTNYPCLLGCTGTYQETLQTDDYDGTLHCTACNHQIKRWE